MKVLHVCSKGALMSAFLVTAVAATASSAVQTSAPAPTDPELPRVSLNTAVSAGPAVTRTIRITSSGALQPAFNAAKDGDKLVLSCGVSYVGNYRLTRAGFTLTSDCAIPAEGVRTSPEQAFARIVSPNVLPAIATNGPANHIRITGIEVTVAAGVPNNQGLITLGCANDCERSSAQQPSDITIDRSYIHGTTTVDVRRCVGLNGARLAIVDSYVSECHSAFDAQAIAGWNGPGPFKISNNYLEGAAENVAFGGADPSISGLVPSDIEITRNHIAKPLAWKGSRWLVKNLLELKVGRRVLIEGNVLENSWQAGQNGLAFVLWSVNQGGTCPWCETSNLTIQKNIIMNVAGGWSLNVMGGDGNKALQAVPMNHIAIRNNIVVGLTGWRTFEITDTIAALSIEHNTAFNPGNSSIVWSTHAPLRDHVVRNNLLGGGQYQLFTSDGQGLPGWQKVAGPGSAFAGNAVVGFQGPGIPNNWYPGAFADLGLVSAAAATSVSATVDQLALGAASGYRGKGTDHKDVGADVAAVKAATANVVQPGSLARVRKP